MVVRETAIRRNKTMRSKKIQEIEHEILQEHLENTEGISTDEEMYFIEVMAAIRTYRKFLEKEESR